MLSPEPDNPGGIVAFGNPMLDITLETSRKFLEAHQIPIDGDCALLPPEKKKDILREVLSTTGAQMLPGGSAVNSIRAAQWMFDGVGLKGRTTVFGAVGEDEAGKILTEACTSCGVEPLFAVISPGSGDAAVPTGHCCVLVLPDTDERSLVGVAGAHKMYSKSPLVLQGSKESKAVVKAKIIYCTSFVLTNEVRTGAAYVLAKSCAASHPSDEQECPVYLNDSKKYFVLNLSSAGIMTKPVVSTRLHELLPYTSLIFGNSQEIQALGSVSSQINGGIDIERQENQIIARNLLQLLGGKFPRRVIVTNGSDSVLVVSQTAHIGQIAIQTFNVPQLEAKIVDSNGAGDAFVGGYLSALYLGRTLDQCISAAFFCASVCLINRGCNFSNEDSDLTRRRNILTLS